MKNSVFVKFIAIILCACSLVAMAFPYIYYIALHISLYHEHWLFMSTDIKSLSLAYCVELRPIMPADDLSVRMCFIACLLDVFLSASIGLCPELDFISDRLRNLHQVIV